MTRIRTLSVLALVLSGLLATGALLLGLFRLQVDASPRTLAPGGSDSADATAEYARQFGGDPVVILIRGPWKTATDTQNIVTLTALEGELRKLPGVKLIEGPGGLVYTAANAALGPALQQLRADAAAAGDAARAAALKAGKSAADADAAARAAQVDTLRNETAALLDRYPAIRETGVPSLENPRFVNALLFHSDGSVKAPFRQLFPRPGATLMVVRLSEDASLTTVRAVRDGVASMLKRYPLTGVGVTVSGAPVVSEGLVNATVTDLRVVLPVAAVVMLVILVASLPGWLGLLPLPVAALGAAYTYGALDLLRHPTTLAAIAAAPILLGLVTDYVVQLAAGGGEEEGATPRRLALRLRALVLAAAATAAGALVLLLSPIPIVSSLGTVVAIGVACGMIALLLAGAPVLLLGGAVARGTRRRLATLSGRLGGTGLHRPAAALAIAAVLGVAGLALTPLQRTTTDLRDFVSGGLPALHDLETLERATGAGGEVDVLVDSSNNVASPAVVGWMLAAEKRLQALLPASSPPPVSLADLLVTVNGGATPTAQATDQILQGLPAYLLEGLVTRDAVHAGISMSIPLAPLGEQEALIQRMRAALQPPAGVTARLAGTAVLAADGEGGLARTGLAVDGLALAAVAVLLLVATRSPARVLVALVPMVLATGWTTLAVVALRIQVTPFTAVLGALVIALATEFSVIWSTRFREARRAGLDAAAAAAQTSERAGAAIAVSGLTLCAGFLALAAGSSPLLRSFGLVAGCGVVAAVLAVLLLCPVLCVRLIRVEPAPAGLTHAEPAPPPPAWTAAPAGDTDG
ncbi:MAG TPA: MMPL family transporter [Candidatus Dormibacteraeota bacterium]|nr:MMPL family transporter [Candidatus Dormibacteraeota bacterium]